VTWRRAAFLVAARCWSRRTRRIVGRGALTLEGDRLIVATNALVGQSGTLIVTTDRLIIATSGLAG